VTAPGWAPTRRAWPSKEEPTIGGRKLPPLPAAKLEKMVAVEPATGHQKMGGTMGRLPTTVVPKH
jgi:hypothetical protein